MYNFFLFFLGKLNKSEIDKYNEKYNQKERIGKELQKDLKRKLIYFYIYRGKNALENGGESVQYQLVDLCV